MDILVKRKLADQRIRHKRQMKEWEKEPIQDRGGAPPPSKPRKPKFTPYEKADTTPTSEDAPFSGTDPMPKKPQFSDQEPPEPKPDYGRKLKRRYEKADTIEKKGPKKADRAAHPDKPDYIIPAGSKHIGQGLHLRGQEAAKKEAGPVTSLKPGDPTYDKIKQEMDERTAQNKQQGHTQNRPLVDPIDAADTDDTRTNIGAGYQSRMKEAVDSETGERFLMPPSTPQSDVFTRKIRKSDDLEEGSRSWSYQG